MRGEAQGVGRGHAAAHQLLTQLGLEMGHHQLRCRGARPEAAAHRQGVTAPRDLHQLAAACKPAQGLIHGVPRAERQEFLGRQQASLRPLACCFQDLGTEGGHGGSGVSSRALVCQKRTQVSDTLSMAWALLVSFAVMGPPS